MSTISRQWDSAIYLVHDIESAIENCDFFLSNAEKFEFTESKIDAVTKIRDFIMEILDSEEFETLLDMTTRLKK